jgi:hypothetical protein
VVGAVLGLIYAQSTVGEATQKSGGAFMGRSLRVEGDRQGIGFDPPRIEDQGPRGGRDAETQGTLEVLRPELTQVMRPESIDAWFDRPIPAFNGNTPRAIVREYGPDPIRDMIRGLRSGIPA